MNKRISVGLMAAIVILFMTITFAAAMIFSMRLFNRRVSSYRERAVMYDKISEIDSLVRESYYGEIDDNALEDKTISGYISGLSDKYCAYLTAAEYAASKSVQEGQALSFGIRVEQNTLGYMEIRAVAPNLPAAVAGLKEGDIVAGIDELTASNTNYDELSEAMNVSEGTTLKFQINRDGKAIVADLTMQKLDDPVVHSYIMGNDIGYIRILSFSDVAPDQFRKVFEAMQRQDIRGLIVDVRSNRIGYDSVENVINIINQLVPTVRTLAEAEYRGGTTRILGSSDGTGSEIPVAVLVNEKTEYMGELFAAVLRDVKAAPVIGVTTVGHGTYQNILALEDGSAVAVSNSVLLAPISGAFNETGVAPDYVVARDAALLTDYAEPSDSTDAQYARAVTVLRALMGGQAQ